MLNGRKIIAAFCSALLIGQIAIMPNVAGFKAIAEPAGVNTKLMSQYGLKPDSYFWKKAIWNRTNSSYARDVVTRPYPRLVGNQVERP
ncbi:MAG: hypothetical protein MZU97_02015 [Bacillus subtilis]|nr:hypothetical protein [Bacillus subtilis]